MRRVAAALLTPTTAASLPADLGPAGVSPVRGVPVPGDGVTRELAARLRAALVAGTLRVHAADLLPGPVAVAFREAVAAYLEPGPPGLPDLLWGPDDAWAAVREQAE